MRFKRHMELEHGLKQIDIAPLIDVMFLLLIFFLLTSNFVMPSGIKVSLPEASTSEMITRKNIIIVVTAENIIYLNGKLVTRKELKDFLYKNRNKNMPVLIQIDRKTSVGRLVEVWDACREHGFLEVNIATDNE
ncbi:MAG: biopolymer transporter ExbD [Candidatus Gygaella obscura]|nr:biopolymer transporter ExbD [Candidatus Gygaella obscura]